MNSTTNHQAPPGSDSGSALVIVLGALAMMTLLVLHIATTTQVVSQETRVRAVESELRYAAESAAERAYWLLLNDRRQHRNRAFMHGDQNQQRWMADSAPRELAVNGYPASVIINDGVRGLDISGPQPDQALQQHLTKRASQWQWAEQPGIEAALVRLRAYTGQESGLPASMDLSEEQVSRYGPLQFREEILWIPELWRTLTRTADNSKQPLEGFRNDYFQAMPPAGSAVPENSKPGFLATPETLVKIQGNFNQTEMTMIRVARNRYLTQREDISLNLDPVIMNSINHHFSLSESGIAEIRVVIADPASGMRRQLSITRDLRRLNDRSAGHPTLGNWEIYRR